MFFLEKDDEIFNFRGIMTLLENIFEVYFIRFHEIKPNEKDVYNVIKSKYK